MSGCLQAVHAECSCLDVAGRDGTVFTAAEEMANAVGFWLLFIDKLRSERCTQELRHLFPWPATLLKSLPQTDCTHVAALAEADSV